VRSVAAPPGLSWRCWLAPPVSGRWGRCAGGVRRRQRTLTCVGPGSWVWWRGNPVCRARCAHWCRPPTRPPWTCRPSSATRAGLMLQSIYRNPQWQGEAQAMEGRTAQGPGPENDRTPQGGKTMGGPSETLHQPTRRRDVMGHCSPNHHQTHDIRPKTPSQGERLHGEWVSSTIDATDDATAAALGLTPKSGQV
jgi:hypothetical protein